MRLRTWIILIASSATALGIACVSGDENGSSRTPGAGEDGGTNGDDDDPAVPVADGSDVGPGPADAGIDACASANLGSDPRHCGACFNDCVHGACSSGVCQPWLVTTLAGNAKGVDTDGKHVYFTTKGEVWRVQVDGGALEQMTTLPNAVSADGIVRGPNAFLVCGNGGNDGGVFVVPTTPGGSAAFLHPTGSCSGIAAAGQTIWTASPSAIVEVNGDALAKHGGGPFGKRPEGDIEVRDGQLYYTSQNTGVNRVKTAQIDSGVTTIFDVQESRGVAIKGDVAYVTGASLPLDGGGNLYRVPLDGGAPSLLRTLPEMYFGQSISVGPDGALYYAAGSNVYGLVPPR